MNKPKEQLVIIGAGGHAKVCYDIAKLMNKWSKILILDDNPKNNFFEIAGPISDSDRYINNSNFFVAIGDIKTREMITNKLLHLKAVFVNLVHPQAVIATDVQIEAGSVVMAGVVINSATNIGKGCIINTSTSVDHDNVIGDFVHISPGTHLAGSVTIGNKTWIGTGCTIINDIKVGSNIIVGAGSLVLNNLLIEKTYYGVPISNHTFKN